MAAAGFARSRRSGGGSPPRATAAHGNGKRRAVKELRPVALTPLIPLHPLRAYNRQCIGRGVPISHHQDGKKTGDAPHTSQKPSKYSLFPHAPAVPKNFAALHTY